METATKEAKVVLMKGFSQGPDMGTLRALWASGITIAEGNLMHINAIECYGFNKEEAEAARDKLLRAMIKSGEF